MSRRAAGLVAASVLWGLAYFAIPVGTASETFWAVGATAITVALVVTVVRLPGPRSGWILIAAAQAFTIAGDFVFTYNVAAGNGYVFPSVGDALYLTNYPLMALGLTQLARCGRGRLRLQPAIDGLILSAAAGLAVWVFFVGPVLGDGSEPMFVRIVAAAYPLGDLLLLVTCTQLLVHRLRPSPALWMLLGAMAVNLAADIVYLYLETYSAYAVGAPVDALWWAAYVLILAAALHPSAATIVGGTDIDASTDLRASRLVLLTIAAIAAPVLHAVLHALGNDDYTGMLIAGTVALFALVIARLWLVASDLEASRAELRYRATHDELTGLANRALFNEQLYAVERVGVAGAAVLLIDIDDFKAINDTFGHSAGDIVLQTVGTRLLRHAPDGSLVARIGGDEFAVLLAVQPHEIEEIASRLVETARAPVEVGVHALSTSISCGGAPVDGTHGTLREADEALYAAKHAGRDRHVVVLTPSASSS